MTAAPTPFVISDDELEKLLNRYTHDITAQERAGRFDPITGRDEEIDQMTLILLQRLRKNIMLLGGAGVGKTALFIIAGSISSRIEVFSDVPVSVL